MPDCDLLSELVFVGRDVALSEPTTFANLVREQLRNVCQPCPCTDGFDDGCGECFQQNCAEYSPCAECVVHANSDQEIVYCVFDKEKSSVGTGVIVMLLLGLFLAILVILIVRHIDKQTRIYKIRKRRLKKTYAIYHVLAHI